MEREQPLAPEKGFSKSIRFPLSSARTAPHIRIMTYTRAILFDKDGTLFDFQASWSSSTSSLIAELSGGDPVLSAVLADAVGYDVELRSFRQGSVLVAGTSADVADALLPYLPNPQPLRSVLIDEIDSRAAQTQLAEAVPLKAYFAALTRAGYGIAVITNDGEAPARAHLEAVGVLDQIGFLAGYDSGHGAKPAPGQILAACAALGILPGAAIMVGDSTHDLLAGRSAGTRTVGVLTGVAVHHDLAPHADVVLPDIGHLPGWLDTQAG
ncbi:HAD family hydrolase [Ovoidimarina sediminis]|uniref:HAD family hydrolase n=1 Tax=Ovoidimarina sediminis TaxID=3079856 RepID=UPI00290FB868|nr:HAD family hydrolase [Rhodophyticola sp. MJ-SS7]MDU8945216.1 HAD family hydrolase [Rhodophyticola sp. MJ-SS7]